MKILNLYLVLFIQLFFFSLNLSAQKIDHVLQDIKVDVVYLASDYLEGRSTGSMGEKLAAAYIATRFEEIGLTPKGTKGKWYQAFRFEEKTNPHEADSETISVSGKNVIGFIDNKAKHTIIIGAHYDHLGMGDAGSRHTGEPAIHNGADDNASGVAAMLSLAAKLKQSKLKNNNYLFMAFSGEEKGLYGSSHFTKNDPTVELATVNYMINMDMVGRLNEEKVLAINGVGTSSVWKDALYKISVDDIKVKTSESGVGPSDHTQFYLKGIPVLHFFTGQHQDYHKPEDDAQLVNFEGIVSVSNFIFQLIEQLEEHTKLPFSKTKDSQDKKAAAFKVTLGVMPDYVFQGKGMRIDAVIDGRPAHKAGLENGDVIIKIGAMEIKDIYGYMEGLAQYKKGDSTQVTVLRKGKEVSAKVKF